MAEPNPIRLASPMMLFVTSDRQQLESVEAAVDDEGQVERPQRLDDGDHQDHDVDRPHDREDDPEERLSLGGAVDLWRPRAGVGSTPFSPAR